MTGAEPTKLTLGPRGKAFERAGILPQLLWSEKYPDQEEPGEFQRTRNYLEMGTVEGILDLWLRGQNLIGFARSILWAVDLIRKVVKRKGVSDIEKGGRQSE